MYSLIKVLDGAWLNIWGSYVKTRTFDTSSFIRSSARAIFRLCTSTAEIYRLKKQIIVVSILHSSIGNCSTSFKNYFRGYLPFRKKQKRTYHIFYRIL